MQKLIDFHVQIFPLPELNNTLGSLRGLARDLSAPLSWVNHEIHSKLRMIPGPARKWVDELSAPLALPHLLLESSSEDLIKQMQKYNVIKAVTVAHPPWSSNDYIFYEARRFEEFIPSILLDPKTVQSKEDLESFYNRGVRVFKVHSALTGEPSDSSYYPSLLEWLNGKKVAVIVHTGEMHSQILFKSPKAAKVSEFEPWFRKYQHIQFVLAHMNFHEPDLAIRSAKNHLNVLLLTSWQPENVIAQAVQEAGAHKVLFASDWPLIGDNVGLQKHRIQNLVDEKKITALDADKIFLENSLQLLQSLGLNIQI